MAEEFNLCFVRPQDMSPEIKIFVWLFYGGFEVMAFFSQSNLLAHGGTGLFFTVDNDTVLPVSASIFTRSFAVVLGLIRTFHTKKRSSLGFRIRLLPERYDGCTFPCFLYLRIIV